MQSVKKFLMPKKQQREAKDKGTGELVFLPVRLLFLS